MKFSELFSGPTPIRELRLTRLVRGSRLPFQPQPCLRSEQTLFSNFTSFHETLQFSSRARRVIGHAALAILLVPLFTARCNVSRGLYVSGPGAGDIIRPGFHATTSASVMSTALLKQYIGRILLLVPERLVSLFLLKVDHSNLKDALFLHHSECLQLFRPEMAASTCWSWI